MALTFFRCNHCGNIVVKVIDKGVPVVCCGEPMEELAPNTVDAATEKHVPVATVDGSAIDVVVGEVEHPMGEDHYITMVVLETAKGFQVAQLSPTDQPRARFAVAEGDSAVAVYEYCNLHGLWVAQL